MAELVNHGFENDDAWFIGEDKTFRYYVRQGAKIIPTATAAKAGTSISVKPLAEDITDEAVIRFRIPGGDGPGILATVDGAHVVGDQALAVDALPGNISAEAVGRKVLDMTGVAMEWVMRDGATGTALLSITPTEQDTEGVVDAVIADTLTLSEDGATILIPAGRYPFAFRQTTDDDEQVLAYGEAQLRLAAVR